MNFYYAVLIICLTIVIQINAKDVIKTQYPVTSIQSPVYRAAPINRQLDEQVPVRLKVFGNNKNTPPKVVARYIPSLNSPRYYRPAIGPAPIRRRYQLSNNIPSQSIQQKRMTPPGAAYQPSSYNKIRRYPTKSYKYPIYYKKKPVSALNFSQDVRKGYYGQQQPQPSKGGTPLEAKISNNQGYYRMNPNNNNNNKKNFYPSPHFDGKIIVKPNDQKYGNVGGNGGKTQYASSALSYQYMSHPDQSEQQQQHFQHKFKSPVYREREPNYNQQEYYQSKRHYGDTLNYSPKQYGAGGGGGNGFNNSPPNKYSSYSVYDDSDDDENQPDDNSSDNSYVTESPIKYYVESTDSSSIDEAKKYLDFMSSSNYFLPKVSPDYHTKSIAYNNNNNNHNNNFNIPTSTEPIPIKLNNGDSYQNYKSHRINLAPGSSTGIRISSKISASGGAGSNNGINNNNVSGNNNDIDSIIVGHHTNNQYDNQHHQQNTFYRPSKKHQQINHQHGPEKIEFTESDAIHSSYTSNPKEILEQSASSGGGNLNSNSGSSIASAVDDIKAKYGLSPKYKVSYQSTKINHHHPHRISKYQSDTYGNSNSNNNSNNNDNDDDIDNDDDDDMDNDDDVNEKK